MDGSRMNEQFLELRKLKYESKRREALETTKGTTTKVMPSEHIATKKDSHKNILNEKGV